MLKASKQLNLIKVVVDGKADKFLYSRVFAR
jgi:hypothetical protein